MQHYQAALLLPTPGTWSWGIAAFGGPETYALTPLQVGEAVGPSEAVLPAAEPAALARWVRAALRLSGVVLLSMLGSCLSLSVPIVGLFPGH